VLGNTAKTPAVAATGEYTGGFIGATYGSANVTIMNSTSLGNVNGSEEVGGLVGMLYQSTMYINGSLTSGNISSANNLTTMSNGGFLALA